MVGSYLMFCETELKIKFSQLNFTAHISAPFHVTSPKVNYNVIFGRDLLRELGINLDFQLWKETKIPMKSIHCKIRANFAIQ